ncbi:MAG: sigma-70 family RNA polymerase sigma factor [Saprospiraceae bacterium]|nr:sigma-70 family RNA polymerase sigma factor [Saprospiraceae bacterium]
MSKVKDGDIDKLNLLFERYHRMLFAFFLKLNRDSGLSKDLVQNVFYRILKYRDRYRNEGEFKHWMFHIARNVQKDHYRRKRPEESEAMQDWEDRLLDSDPGPSRAFEKREELALLRKALQHLPPEKREILMLSKIKGMRYKDIGKTLGYTEGNVKVRVFRAMEELRNTYEKLRG